MRNRASRACCRAKQKNLRALSFANTKGRGCTITPTRNANRGMTLTNFQGLDPVSQISKLAQATFTCFGEIGHGSTVHYSMYSCIYQSCHRHGRLLLGTGSKSLVALDISQYVTDVMRQRHKDKAWSQLKGLIPEIIDILDTPDTFSCPSRDSTQLNSAQLTHLSLPKLTSP